MTTAQLKLSRAYWARAEKLATSRHDKWQTAYTQARRKNTHPRKRLETLRNKWSVRLDVCRKNLAERDFAIALTVVVPGMPGARAQALADVLPPAFRAHGITTPRRAAAAVAQFAEESASFSTTTEFASGQEYEGRRDLGNTHPGDGVRFKGRGYIQITGRANYAAISHVLGHDFIARPTDLAQPKWAAQASCSWWESHGLNAKADANDFVGITRTINGGVNGLAMREAYWHRAQTVASKLVP